MMIERERCRYLKSGRGAWTVLSFSSVCLFGCGPDVTKVEEPIYQAEVELSSREEVYKAVRDLQYVIEENCEVVGHERPRHQMVNGPHALMLIFSVHDLDGDRSPGAVVFSSFGEAKLSAKLSLFASAFKDEEQLGICISAIESRIASGFEQPFTVE